MSYEMQVGTSLSADWVRPARSNIILGWPREEIKDGDSDSAAADFEAELGYDENSLIDKISALLRPFRRPLSQRESIGLVFFCTLIGAGAQVLMKIGAQNLPTVGAAAVLANPFVILYNVPLMGGLSLYGIFTALLIIALRDGELSIIYPVIALTYVWVTFLSLLLFRETMNPFKACGITVIVAGVMVLGRSGRR